MRLSQIARWARGELRGPDGMVAGVGIDSRTVRTGELFVALPGRELDGHDFVAVACASRAVGALVARWLPDVPCPQIRVDDPVAALQRIACEYRATLSSVRIAAITGSNGKTTTKEMASVVLASQGPCVESPGNWNNHLGVPLTLLRITPAHRYAVVEMGANHPGEITDMMAWTKPSTSTVTCAAEAHLEGFGDLDGVARAKGEIFSSLPGEGVAVINADDRYAERWREMAAPRQVLAFGSDTTDADAVRVRLLADALEFSWRSQVQRVRWSLPGEHNARNAACAVALGMALGVDFASAAGALDGFENPACGRLRIGYGPNGAQLIDDTYNANPSSFRAGIDVLVQRAPHCWLVMGEMRELGARSDACHEEVARYAREAGIERLFAFGPQAERCVRAFGEGARVCTDLDEITEQLRSELRPDCAVLVKGSRAARLERLVDRIWIREAMDAA